MRLSSVLKMLWIGRFCRHYIYWIFIDMTNFKLYTILTLWRSFHYNWKEARMELYLNIFPDCSFDLASIHKKRERKKRKHAQKRENLCQLSPPHLINRKFTVYLIKRGNCKTYVKGHLRMRTITNLLIFNLSLADMINTIFNSTFSYVFMKNR